MDTVTTAPQKVFNPQAKHWAGCTIPNYTEEDIKSFEKIKPLVDYFVYGKEVGAGGLPHLQFMICFKTQRRLTAVKKLFPTQGHWEMKAPKSTMLRASNYCKKGDQSKEEWNEWHEQGPNFGKQADFVEFGTLPLDQTVASRKVIMDKYEDTVDKARNGKIEDIIPEHQLRYYGAIKKIQADTKKMPENLTWKEGHQPNFWIHGNTGMRRSKSTLNRGRARFSLIP